MSVSITVTGTTAASRERAFDVIAPIDLASIFRRVGPLPAVAGTRDQTGRWDHVGASRVVRLADGGELHEELTAFERPRHFAYRLHPLSGPMGRLVAGADGAWWFEEGGEIRWTYTFHPRRLRALPVRLVLAPLWRVYASRALGRAVAAAEEDA